MQEAISSNIITKRFSRAADGITEVVNRAPFIGKILLTPLVKDATQEKDPYVKRGQLARAIAFIPTLAWLHTYQIQRGIETFQSISQNPRGNHITEMSVAGAYALINAGVVFAQLNIARHLVDKFRTNEAFIADSGENLSRREKVKKAVRGMTTLKLIEDSEWERRAKRMETQPFLVSTYEGLFKDSWALKNFLPFGQFILCTAVTTIGSQVFTNVALGH